MLKGCQENILAENEHTTLAQLSLLNSEMRSSNSSMIAK